MQKESQHMETIRQIIQEHISFKKQIITLAKSDIVKKYRGAALGWAWAIIKPMITLFVFWFAFTIGLRHGSDVAGYPYFLWLVAGFTPWFYMSSMITGGAGCIKKYKHLVTKMKFPVSIIPTYVNLGELLVNSALLVIAIVLFLCWGYKPDIYYLQLPIYIFMMFFFFTVWSLFSGLLSCISTDFQNLVKSFSTAIFWMSGIIYNVNTIENHTLRIILKLNPVTDIASGYRDCFIYKKWFGHDMVAIAGYLITTTVMVIGALWAYRRLRKEIPDVM